MEGEWNIRSRSLQRQKKVANEDTPLIETCESDSDNDCILDSGHEDGGQDSYQRQWDQSYNSNADSSVHSSVSYTVGTSNLVSQKYESLDYDICENLLFIEEQRHKKKETIRFFTDSNRTQHGFSRIQYLSGNLASVGVLRWLVMFLIGVLTAMTACVITITIEELSSLKFSFLKNNVDKCPSYSCLIVPFLFWLLFCSVPVIIGSFLVSYVAPVAAGSGIPVIKCYLNGVKVPEVVRAKTLFVKAIGVMTSVVGGLAVGKEGPMIHCGAVIAAGVSQGKSTTMKKDFKVFEKFREDHEKRDFVSAGAAAGVAAAFGAPVGGVLFSLEEGASFWNQALTWRIFFCSMVSFFTLNLILSTYHQHPGQLSYPGLVNFGQFENITYSVLELPMYIIFGAMGGLLGALYNYLNFKLTIFRLRYVKHPAAKVAEAAIVSLVGVAIAFLTILLSKDCQTLGNDPIKYPIQLSCSDSEYSAFGAIWFQTPEASLRSLFHDPEGAWSPWTLAIFFVCYLILGCWTYGLSVSSGLFIPTLLIGAAWGRLAGIGVSYLARLAGLDEAALCPAKFAIIGAAATLAGVVRMTISLTVILMEAIGNITFGLPIMISVMTAKWVGDYFNEGLYDTHIQLASVPILGWEPPPNTYHIYVSKVMSSPVVCFKCNENVGKIVEILESESHNGFPVVDYTEDSCDGEHTFGTFRGIILRWQLIVLLQHKIFNETVEKHWRAQKLTLKDFRDAYPRHPPVQQIHISPQERNFTIDLRPYMNPAAYTIASAASLPRIFRLFRALGLRHLPVVDSRNCVVGIITRKDIARFRAKKHYGRIDLEELHISYG